MCEPKFLIFNKENYIRRRVRPNYENARTLEIPLVRPPCSDLNIPLCDFVNKCQAVLKFKAQLAHEQRLAEWRKEALKYEQNKECLQVLPDYHNKKFTSNFRDSRCECLEKKEFSKKSKFLKSCKHISPELEELLNPTKEPITQICFQPQHVTCQTIQDPREKSNQPIVLNEKSPELVKYIFQLIKANSETNAMYGIEFEKTDGPKIPTKAHQNPYEILTPTVIENLLNKLMSTCSLSQKELEMLECFLNVAKRLSPNDLSAYFRLLKMRGVVMADTINKLQSRLLESKSNVFSLMKVENFLKDLKQAVLFRDPKQVEKQRKRIAVELSMKLKNALKEAEDWTKLTSTDKKSKKADGKAGILKSDEQQRDARGMTSTRGTIQLQYSSMTKEASGQPNTGKGTIPQAEQAAAQESDSKKNKEDSKKLTEKSKESKDRTSRTERKSKKDKEQLQETTTTTKELTAEQPNTVKGSIKHSHTDEVSNKHKTHSAKTAKAAEETIKENETPHVKSPKLGVDKDFRSKFASAMSAAEKYVDKALDIQKVSSPADLRYSNNQYGRSSGFIEFAKQSTTYNDSKQMIDRFSYRSTGAHMPGYFEPWDIEWPWSDLQDIIGYRKMLYLKPVPNPDFSFRSGMEYYQALMQRSLEPPPPPPPPQVKTKRTKSKSPK